MFSKVIWIPLLAQSLLLVHCLLLVQSLLLVQGLAQNLVQVLVMQLALVRYAMKKMMAKLIPILRDPKIP